MSATKWKTRGFVRPWAPRNWPIPHIGECRAASIRLAALAGVAAQRRDDRLGTRAYMALEVADAAPDGDSESRHDQEECHRS